MQEKLRNCEILMAMYKRGLLGGEVMPEDENPHLDIDSLENFLYFTLPMSLNYQRNSYTLWEAALNTYNDKETKFVFSPKEVLEKSFEEVQKALTKYRVALQKQKQTEIWIKLCKTFIKLLILFLLIVSLNLYFEFVFDLLKFDETIKPKYSTVT